MNAANPAGYCQLIRDRSDLPLIPESDRLPSDRQADLPRDLDVERFALRCRHEDGHVSLRNIAVVPVPVRDAGGQHDQMACWHLVVFVGDVDRQDPFKHEVELVEGVNVPGRAR